MTFCNYEFTKLHAPGWPSQATLGVFTRSSDNVQDARRRGRAAETSGVSQRAERVQVELNGGRRAGSAPSESRASYFSPPPCAVRRASSSEWRMSIAIVDSAFAAPVFSSCSIARTSVSDSSGRLTEVSAVGLLPFAD
jgi:hypothetical protein